MRVQVIVPELGVEPDSDLVVSMWFAELGEEVLEGDRLVELLAGAMTFDVQAPVTGRLVQINYYEDDPVQAGDVLGLIEPMEESDTIPTPPDSDAERLPDEPDGEEELELEELALEELGEAEEALE